MIPLKVITEYSLLKSLIKIPDLIKHLTSHNINVCGICDDELFGVMEFYFACKDNHIKPIIGLEVKVNDNIFYLYPKNELGYKKLLKINTLKFDLNLSYHDIEDDNIFIVIPFKYHKSYDNFTFKNNLYISYKNDYEKKNSMLITNNVLYINPIRCFSKEDTNYFKYLNMLGGVFEGDESDYFEDALLKEDEYLLKEFCNKIDLKLSFEKRYIPVYSPNAREYLKKLAFMGLEKRLHGNVTDIYKDRLNEELKVINDLGFTNYFLIVYDYVLYAKKNGIMVGPGRGSAAGSLVSFSVGITDIDPIKYDLLFARFLNPYRKKMPDIDIDFEDTKRSEVISYVKEKYGKENVAVGITFNSLKAKLVLRDLARVLKVNENLFEKFIKVIDKDKNLLQNKKNEDVLKYLKMYKELDNLYTIAIKLEGLKKNVSTHAAGVVISSESLDEIIPIYKEEDDIKTGIAMEYLEKLGLLKMDFLALNYLTVIDNICKKINDLNIKKIPLDDPKVYELFWKGDTDNIFQFESNYAKNNLIKIKPKNFLELAIAIALVRPGPSNQIDLYIQNKNSNDYEVHPSVKDILKDTYGVIIYQEQVMKILEVIGGYSPYEADNVRIAISKKKEDIILKEEQRFYERAIKGGYHKDFVESIFDKIKRFAEYGFNKAHSISYALISYELAYLKVNYPVEFNLSILENAKDYNTKKRILNILKGNGIKILKPNINVSNKEFEYKNNYLLLPFTIVRNLNNNLVDIIISKRGKGYEDIYDFVIKCDEVLDFKTYEVLVKSGILDTFKINRKTLIHNYDLLKNYASLGGGEKPLLDNVEEYSLDELRNFESMYYGFYIGNHPSSLYHNVVKIKDYKKYLFKNINLALLVERVKEVKTKNGDIMAFVKASDETGEVDLVLFPSVYKNTPNLKFNDIILVNGKPTQRYDKYQINVNKIKKAR